MLECFLGMAKEKTEQIKELLAVEENGIKIAFMQGQVSGFRRLLKILDDCGVIYEIKPQKCIFSYSEGSYTWRIDPDEEKKFSKIVLENMVYNAFQMQEKLKEKEVFDKINSRLEEQKDWLFYEAEKGRDLHFCRGFYSMLCVLSFWTEALSRSEKEKDIELFDIPEMLEQ